MLEGEVGNQGKSGDLRDIPMALSIKQLRNKMGKGLNEDLVDYTAENGGVDDKCFDSHACAFEDRFSYLVLETLRDEKSRSSYMHHILTEGND